MEVYRYMRLSVFISIQYDGPNEQPKVRYFKSIFRTRFFPEEGPLLETSIFFKISYDSYQPFNFLPHLSLSIIDFKSYTVWRLISHRIR